MHKSHDYFMMQAIKLSKESLTKKLSGGPFGCVIVKDGQIIAKGKNQVLQHNDPTQHGEIVAIRKACRKLKTFDLSGCDLYTNCEPCPMCLMTCKWANIKHIYFAATRKTAAKIGFRDEALYGLLKKGTSSGKQIQSMEQEAVKAMLEWKEKYRNTTY